jgi:tRNA (guanosine-2'-O-)-methyltransferase
MPNERRVARMRKVLERRQEDLTVVIENLWDPHNVSAIVRSADGFGAGSVQMLYWIEESPKISRGVSAHTNKWTFLKQHSSVPACVEAMHAQGLRVVATNVDETARGYLDFDWTQPTALVVGNEQRGCSPELLALADEQVAIPMLGFAQSFNVSVAAAVILGEISRQRQAVGMLEPNWSHTKQRWFDYWVARDSARERRNPPPEAP